MLRTVHSEQIKLTTLRSTWWSVALTIGVSVAAALLLAGTAGGEAEESVDIITVLFLVPSQLALIALMAMAAIVATSEYRFGQVRMTLAAQPSRWQMLAAKAVVTLIVAFSVGAITAWLCVTLTKPLFPADWKLDFSADEVMQTIWGLPLFFAVAALLAMSLGAILRNSPAAITILAVFPLVVEKILLAIPKTNDFAQYLPFNAGQRIIQPLGADGFDNMELSPWEGFALFTGYALLLFVIATILTELRDA